MFFCENCGNKIDNNNNFCVNCGNKINRVNNNSINFKNEESNGLKIASIVLGSISIVGCIFFPISIILSIIGLILGIIATKKGKNMLGIILNVIGLLLSMLIIFIIVLFMGGI